MDRSTNHTPKSNPRVYTGTDNLYNLLIEGDVFVDKSLFIKEFLQDSSGEVILITRPRRWGKSLNNEVLKLFRELLGNTFKSNPYLKRGLITGILRVAKASLFSSINNVQEHTLLDEQFATSYGFTQQEVNELFDQVPTSTTLDHVKRWYNGYKFGTEVLYNPWSIMCCLARGGVLDTYWVDSGGTQLETVVKSLSIP